MKKVDDVVIGNEKAIMMILRKSLVDHHHYHHHGDDDVISTTENNHHHTFDDHHHVVVVKKYPLKSTRDNKRQQQQPPHHDTMMRLVVPNTILIIIIIITMVVVLSSAFDVTKLTSTTTTGDSWKDWTQVNTITTTTSIIRQPYRSSEIPAPPTMAMSGNGTVIAVGIPSDEGNGTYYAATYRYEWTGSMVHWVSTDRPIVDDDLPHHHHPLPYGDTRCSVALDDSGLIIAIGSPYSYRINGTTMIVGLVRVYRWNIEYSRYDRMGSDIYGIFDSSHIPKLIPEMIGWSVDLSKDGNIIAMTAEGYYVQVYQYNPKIYEWMEYGNRIITTNGYFNYEHRDSSPYNGVHVRLSGNGTTLVVATPYYCRSDIRFDEHRYPFTCRNVTVYKMMRDHIWMKLGESLSGDVAGDDFGYSFAISYHGNMITSCAPYRSLGIKEAYQNGICRIYRYHETTNHWNQVGQPIYGQQLGQASNGDIIEFFGSDCDMNDDGTIIAIGAKWSHTNDLARTGRVQIWQWNVNASTWDQMGHDIVGNNENDHYGSAITLSRDGTMIAIAAASDGNVFVYQVESKNTSVQKKKKNVHNGLEATIIPTGSIDRELILSHGSNRHLIPSPAHHPMNSLVGAPYN